MSNPFADKYFETEGLWEGLPNLEGLARSIRDGDESAYSTLHCAQLIKHSLGLRHAYHDRFSLLYYWHYIPSEIGDKHQVELAAFEEVVRQDISFDAMTVEELTSRFIPNEETGVWLNYLVTRYVSPGHQSSG